MKIIIDAMGGDNAPQAIVEGAVSAQREFGVDIVLVGRENEVVSCLKPLGAENDPHISVVNADEVIDMHDDPAWRWKCCAAERVTPRFPRGAPEPF